MLRMGARRAIRVPSRHDFCGDHRRRAHAAGQAQRSAPRLASGRSRGRGAESPRRSQRRRPRSRRRRGHGLRDAGREQAINVARNAVLAAGWPETVPGTTIDRQCGSSQQAAHFAAQGVIAGAYDVVVAAGVEVMTRVPMGSSMADGKFGWPFGPAVGARYADQGGLVPQGISAELIADKWNLTREELDEFGAAASSSPPRPRPRVASSARSFRCSVPAASGHRDEGLRETTVESLAQLKPSFRSEEEGGRITAGNSSQISDGASAVLIMSEENAAELGPRRVPASSTSPSPPPTAPMLTAPIPATQKVLDRSGCRSTTSTSSRSTRPSRRSCSRGRRSSRPNSTRST